MFIYKILKTLEKKSKNDQEADKKRLVYILYNTQV